MNTKSRALCALLVLSGSLLAAPAATTSAAATTAKPAAAAPTAKVKAEKPAAMHARGEVVSVDAVANTLTVKGKKADETFTVAATAKIKKGKTEIKLGDILAGDKVSVTYLKDSGVMTASAVKVMPAKAASAPAAVKK